MTEDFAFSTVLFYYCTKLTQVQNDRIFYCQHDVTSTSIQDITFSKAEKNIHDMNVSFTFVENFMKKVGIYHYYNDKLEKIKQLIASPKIKCVSFDIFDTLITRPFYEPLDMFRIMDKDYRELTHNDVGINFSKIRVISENICRIKKIQILI